jgi:hypothetical protein
MHLIAVAWAYVVLMAALAEAFSPQGAVLGAIFTFIGYGLVPLTIVLYLAGTPARKRALKRAELAERGGGADTAPSDPPDGRGHAPPGAVAPERKEP